MFGLIGPNGCGKTTTLRVLSGLLRPKAGSVEMLGRTVGADPEWQNARIGYVPDLFKGFDHLRVDEFMHLMGRLHRAGADYVPRAVLLARSMSLSTELQTLLGELSYGTRRKVGIVAAAVLLATQDVFFAERVCDEVGLLADGRVVACGSPVDLSAQWAQPTLRDALLAASGLSKAAEEIGAALAPSA